MFCKWVFIIAAAFGLGRAIIPEWMVPIEELEEPITISKGPFGYTPTPVSYPQVWATEQERKSEESGSWFQEFGTKERDLDSEEMEIESFLNFLNSKTLEWPWAQDSPAMQEILDEEGQISDLKSAALLIANLLTEVKISKDQLASERRSSEYRVGLLEERINRLSAELEELKDRNDEASREVSNREKKSIEILDDLKAEVARLERSLENSENAALRASKRAEESDEIFEQSASFLKRAARQNSEFADQILELLRQDSQVDSEEASRLLKEIAESSANLTLGLNLAEAWANDALMERLIDRKTGSSQLVKEESEISKKNAKIESLTEKLHESSMLKNMCFNLLEMSLDSPQEKKPEVTPLDSPKLATLLEPPQENSEESDEKSQSDPTEDESTDSVGLLILKDLKPDSALGEPPKPPQVSQTSLDFDPSEFVTDLYGNQFDLLTGRRKPAFVTPGNSFKGNRISQN